MKVLIGIPCYNVENQIVRILRDFRDAPEFFQQDCIVAIIDNQSLDKTIEKSISAIKEFGLTSKVHVFRNFKNIGLGGTHKVAFQLANQLACTHLAILHGDHQATTLQIFDLFKASEKNLSHSVLGSRFLPGSFLPGYSFTRIVGNRALNVIYSFLTGTKVHDLGVGINLFNLRDVNEKEIMQFDDSFTFNMDLLLHLIERKVPFCFYPVDWKVADEKSNAKVFSVGWKTLVKVFRWKFFSLDRKNIQIEYRTEKIF